MEPLCTIMKMSFPWNQFVLFYPARCVCLLKTSFEQRLTPREVQRTPRCLRSRPDFSARPALNLSWTFQKWFAWTSIERCLWSLRSMSIYCPSIEQDSCNLSRRFRKPTAFTFPRLWLLSGTLRQPRKWKRPWQSVEENHVYYSEKKAPRKSANLKPNPSINDAWVLGSLFWVPYGLLDSFCWINFTGFIFWGVG